MITSADHAIQRFRMESGKPLNQLGKRVESIFVSRSAGLPKRIKVFHRQEINFQQVRLLGLEGNFTRILTNGRPTLSSLASVYGVEQIPVALVERIEIVKGVGSAAAAPGAWQSGRKPADEAAHFLGGALVVEGGEAGEEFLLE